MKNLIKIILVLVLICSYSIIDAQKKSVLFNEVDLVINRAIDDSLSRS